MRSFALAILLSGVLGGLLVWKGSSGQADRTDSPAGSPEATPAVMDLPAPPSDPKVHRFHYLRTKSYSAGGQTHEIKEYRHETTGLEFALLPEGAPLGPPIPGRGERVLIVKAIPSFLICRTEVTQKVWKAVMGINPSSRKGDDLPVDSVTWYQAKAFCIRTGLDLPHEVEWEYACRGKTESPFYWGEKVDLEFCWLEDNAVGRTRPAGKRKPNAFGLFDMVGNVHEWCQSWYHQSGMSYFPEQDELREGEKPLRVLRGGSVMSATCCAFSGARSGNWPKKTTPYDGFRPIRRLEGAVLVEASPGD